MQAREQNPASPPDRKASATSLRKIGVTSAALFAALMGTGGWLAWQHGHRPAPPAAPQQAYTAQGYGGFLPTATAPLPVVPPHPPAGRPVRAGLVDPIQPLREAYNAGHYGEVETAAAQVIRAANQHPTLPRRKAAAQAGSLMAYAAARRHDLSLARTRFATARTQAAGLPDRGRQPARIGENPATLEEDDAFQHAVCTGALGDKPAAEAEYVAFMRRYPESPLVQAAAKRIARMHGGNLPPDDEAVWREAKLTIQKRQAARQREASLCGPECLAELLRRRGDGEGRGDGERASASAPSSSPNLVHRLAQEMGTGENGTSLAALASSANRHGFHARGLALSQRGLTAQRLPVIALIMPGHYVLVEAASPGGVTLWDPDAHGTSRGGRATVPLAVWQRQWRGVTLALAPEASAVQTARR